VRNRIFRFYIYLGHTPPRFAQPFYGLELVDMVAWIKFWIRVPMGYFEFFFSRHSVLIRLEVMGRGLVHKIFWRTRGYKKYGSSVK